jgi:hypothetical protein
VCNITENIIKSRNDTQDVLIKTSDSNIWSGVINDIIDCLDDDIAIVINDIEKNITTYKLRKPSVVILMINSFNEVRNII